jgi:protein-tyrosine phosphatase
MPEVIDWQTVPDPDDAIRAALNALAARRPVALPTETGYVVAVGGCSPEAAASLRALVADPAVPVCRAVSAEAIARLWAPSLGPIGRRFARRLLPGPVTLALSNAAASRLPEAERAAADELGTLHVRSPSHEAVRELLRLIPAPVLLADVASLTATESAACTRLPDVLTQRLEVVIQDGPARFPEGTTVVGIDGDRWQVLREGAVPADLVARQTVCLIVFVCTGNTCRSPMADALCKKRLSERLGCRPDELLERGYAVTSAGLSANPGWPAATEAVEAATVYGGDLSAHRSRPMTAELLLQADYVVGMTREHVEALREASAGLTEPPRLLSPHGDDLTDPVGLDRDVYRECAAAIWQHVDALAAEVLSLSAGTA